MSSRVTRSSARQSAESSLLSLEPLAPAPAPAPPLSSSSASRSKQTSNTKKRKAPTQDSDLEDLPTAADPPPTRRSKRRKEGETEETQVVAPEVAPAPKSKRKGKAAMSYPGPSQDPSDENLASPHTAASTSKRKSGKSKKIPTDTSTPLTSKQRSKGKKPKDTLKVSESKPEASVARTPAEPKSGEATEESGNDEPSRAAYDDEDEEMDDDPFESSFLGRHGASSSSTLNTLRALSGMMSGMTSRLRRLLDSLRQKEDPSIQHIALQELSELLLVSTEENLAGHFSPDQYVKELVALMQPNEFGEENPEMMLLACRCIANLMEALPAATASVAYGGAVPVLISKLLEIQYMDLAEQALITLENISVEFPASIVRDGGLTACLTYLDFFATSTQRTAVTTAANCCRNIPDDSFSVVKDVMPILLNVLSSNDQRVMEQGCLCVSRIVESFKYQDDKLEELMSTDLLKVILRLLLPGSTNLIGPTTHTQFLRVLAFTARASSRLTVELFKMNVVDTLYQILTGVSPPSGDDDVAQNLDSVVIMQALIHRPRDQIFETLNVICELLPGLDKTGTTSLDGAVDRIIKTGDAPVLRSKKTSADKRAALQAQCKKELRRFVVILLPTLTDAYSSTVNLSVRQRVMIAQLKMLDNCDTDILEDALRVVPYASFLASILSQQDHQFLVVAALQAAEILLKRLESIYRYQFYREGVIAEVKKIATRPLSSKTSDDTPGIHIGTAPVEQPGKANTSGVSGQSNVEADMERDDNEEDDDHDHDHEDEHDDGSGSSDDELPHTRPVTIPISYDVEDVITKYAKAFVGMYENEAGNTVRLQAGKILMDLQHLVSDIAACFDDGRATDGAKLFAKLAHYFEGDALDSITSYELLTSKVVSTLLDIFQEADGESTAEAKKAFVVAFMESTVHQKIKTTTSGSPLTPFSVLVTKLQDLLSRAEHFEVTTVHQNAFDSNRSSAASMLAKQIRIKLVADDDSGIPKPYRNIMVSIHAIATFKALDDYLRPRISMSDRPRPNRTRGLPEDATNAYLAALAGLEASNKSALMGSMSQATPTRASTKKTSRSKGPASPAETSTPSNSENPSSGTRSGRNNKAAQAQESVTEPAAAHPADDDDDLRNALECADEAPITDEEDEDIAAALDTIVGEIEEELSDDEGELSAVNLEVAPTGNVTARKEDGTRVATPTKSPGQTSTLPLPPPPPISSEESRSAAMRSLLSSVHQRQASYAAALQAVPHDWHLEFSVDGQEVTNETTIYRAVHMHQLSLDEATPRNVWSAVHSINFKKVQGPPLAEPSTLSLPTDLVNTDFTTFPPSLAKNPTTAGILQLLRILHELNSGLDEVVQSPSENKLMAEPLLQFVNNKLTAKLNRQLEEPLIVASSCLPGWSEDLARLYPFLFPFETRHLFLQSTSFGYSRSMTRWQNTQTTNDSSRGRHRDERPFLGRLQRQKVRISRQKLFESAIKVMELYGASPSVLEVEYFDEVGTGLGPTLEFYSTVSKEFSKRKLRLWRDHDAGTNDDYIYAKNGLFPAPMAEGQALTENGKRALLLFKILGKFVARSMLDSRIIDVTLNPVFFRVGDSTSWLPTLTTLKAVDPELANSLQILMQFVNAKRKIDDQQRLTAIQRSQKISLIQVQGMGIQDLALDFTLPGYESIELIPNGSNVTVTIDNVSQYVQCVIDYTVGTGVRSQIDAFREGFSQVFPYNALKAFTPDELVMLFGRTNEDWSIETLMDSIKADHGYNLDSKSVRNLLQTMSELSDTGKRDFLQFVTGSPKLPIGGFKSLTPMFTVVCKPSEPPFSSDDYLPSVMTCVNYLKMPDYSNLDVLRKKLSVAIKEGQGAFHLS